MEFIFVFKNIFLLLPAYYHIMLIIESLKNSKITYVLLIFKGNRTKHKN